jgi:GNAT superfamily N-acetyltransferase
MLSAHQILRNLSAYDKEKDENRSAFNAAYQTAEQLGFHFHQSVLNLFPDRIDINAGIIRSAFSEKFSSIYKQKWELSDDEIPILKAADLYTEHRDTNNTSKSANELNGRKKAYDQAVQKIEQELGKLYWYQRSKKENLQATISILKTSIDIIEKDSLKLHTKIDAENTALENKLTNISSDVIPKYWALQESEKLFAAAEFVRSVIDKLPKSQKDLPAFPENMFALNDPDNLFRRQYETPGDRKEKERDLRTVMHKMLDTWETEQKKIHERQQFRDKHNSLEREQITEILSQRFGAENVSLKDGYMFGVEGECYEIEVRNSRTGNPAFFSRILWIPEKKTLGIVDFNADRSSQGRGVGSQLFSNLLELGKALGADKINLLAGEKNGPIYWAKMGFYAAENSTKSSGGFREEGDQYYSWRELCDRVEDSLRLEREHPQEGITISKLNEIEELLDPAKPENLVKLIAQSPLLEALGCDLNALKFNATFDLKNPAQMEIARTFIDAHPLTIKIPSEVETSEIQRIIMKR